MILFFIGGIFPTTLRTFIFLCILCSPILSPYLRACRRNISMRRFPYIALLHGKLQCSNIEQESISKNKDLKSKSFMKGLPCLRFVLSSVDGIVEEDFAKVVTISTSNDGMNEQYRRKDMNSKVMDFLLNHDGLDAIAIVACEDGRFQKFDDMIGVYVAEKNAWLSRDAYPAVRPAMVQELAVGADMYVRSSP